MLRVLRHYLPIRKALLIGSETVLLTLVLAAWTTAHLWQPSTEVSALLGRMVPSLQREGAIWRCVLSSLLLAVLAQLAIAFNELYDARISGSRYDRASRFVESAGSALALTLGCVLLAHLWRFEHVLDFPPLSLSQRVQTLVFALLSGFLVLYNWRSLYQYFQRKASFRERVLILGAGRAAHQLAREMLERPDAGYEVVGLLPEEQDERSKERGARTSHAALADSAAPSAGEGEHELALDTQSLVLAPLAATALLEASPERGNGHATTHVHQGLFELVQASKVDVLIVALENRRNNLPTEELLRCRLAGIPVREQEAIYEQITGKIAVEALRPSYLIFNEGFSRHPWNALTKRGFDLFLASLMIVLTWPLMIITAIFVHFDSEGPILFSQERMGRDGKLFTLFKFRSMRADAERMTGPVWATEDDPRITRAGRFIRKARLDELPQLFNVMAGQMSIVGPRPEREHFVLDLAKKIPYFRQRHIVKPGLTGWAQINYRYGSSFEDALQKLQYDLFYIKNQSLLFDLSILFNTIKIVILRKGT